jgi:DNA invertase Pin-like site-specific DNA recombinase
MESGSFKKAVVYSRVSTSDKGQNPEIQRSELERYCHARGWTITETVVDHGYGGGSDVRPGLKQVMAIARSRRCDVIVVTKLDRLARSLKHLLNMLDELNALGVAFVSVNDQMDLTTASGRLMMQILGSFAEFERALIRERTLAGLAYARSQGKKLGRPKTRNDEAILKLRGQGLSYSAIERELGCERSSIYRALRAVAKTQSRSEFQSAEKSRHQKGEKPHG